jgi:hypothetical protein
VFEKRVAALDGGVAAIAIGNHGGSPHNCSRSWRWQSPAAAISSLPHISTTGCVPFPRSSLIFQADPRRRRPSSRSFSASLASKRGSSTHGPQCVCPPFSPVKRLLRTHRQRCLRLRSTSARAWCVSGLSRMRILLWQQGIGATERPRMDGAGHRMPVKYTYCYVSCCSITLSTLLSILSPSGRERKSEDKERTVVL